MRKDVREFIRRLESVGLTVESAPGHYHVLRDGNHCGAPCYCRWLSSSLSNSLSAGEMRAHPSSHRVSKDSLGRQIELERS